MPAHERHLLPCVKESHPLSAIIFLDPHDERGLACDARNLVVPRLLELLFCWPLSFLAMGGCHPLCKEAGHAFIDVHKGDLAGGGERAVDEIQEVLLPNR